MTTLLACGPYFEPSGVYASLAIFLVFKPLSYFAFVQAFRYRVARSIPMTIRQATKLAAQRAILGVSIVVAGAAILALLGLPGRSGAWLIASWLYLYASRVLAWWFVGAKGAGLRGHRLAAWIIFGTLINVAFDAAIVGGLMEGILVPSLIFAGIMIFIWILHVSGRRDALRLKFDADPHCTRCRYNLRGNISGVCPECGTPIAHYGPRHRSPATAPSRMT